MGSGRRRTWADDDLVVAVSSSATWQQVAEFLGLSIAGNTIRSLRERAAFLSLDISDFPEKRSGPWSKVRLMDDEKLAMLVSDSKTWGELTFEIGYSSRSAGMKAALRQEVEKLGLDTSHFNRYGVPGSESTSEDRKQYLLGKLRYGTGISSKEVKLLVEFGILEWKCVECGITEWNDKEAPLQLDHMDGDRWNNVISNLRFLCANCHMQTDTWGNKGNRRTSAYLERAERIRIDAD